MRKTIKVGNIEIGNGHIVIQSMTNTKTSDIEKTIKQIIDLTNNGCEIVRVAIKDMNDAYAISKIKEQINCPLIADIHFDYKLAIESINQGIDKIRINPGNMPIEHLETIITACKNKNIPIRIGVNSGSLSKDIVSKYGISSTALIEEMKREIKIIESPIAFAGVYSQSLKIFIPTKIIQMRQIQCNSIVIITYGDIQFWTELFKAP